MTAQPTSSPGVANAVQTGQTPAPDKPMDPRPPDEATSAAQEVAASFDIGIVQSKRIRRLNTYWQARGKGKVPSRSAIDPVDVSDLLPNILMMDVLRDPLRFRFRLVGTRVVQYTGFDFTGRCLQDLVFQGRDFLEQCYHRIMAERKPIFGHYSWLVRSRHFGQCEFGLFPLSDDGVTVNRAIAIEDYERMERDILSFGQSGAPGRKLDSGV